MRSIKQLPKAVHSSLRSSVVLFDLTRVVEELIFNSIDAAATKVNVAVSVGTCYVKVDDDGCGITRDGLVLLGEKYATSKLQYLAEMDAATDSFGFRGEALGSLSDISLLEIITKARGMPNGYRKIIKGCKCLYLGIDDKKQGFGTTVIVRDLFYNQPVRRKYMQSSSKKVLDSVKKCVLRIALVHPQISFKVNDVESGDELLCTDPSLSPLSLVASGFGTDISGSLCEVSFSEGVLNLSGYLSGRVDSFFMKVDMNINSRFVCKGPIHKLLNNLAASSNSLDMWEGALGSQNCKRKTQSHPAFILNLRCPRSSYDLTFEPSKTLVEFKDWIPVLSFIEQAFRHFWGQTPPRELCSHDDEVSGKDEIWKEDNNGVLPIQDKSVKSICPKEKGRIHHNQTYLHLSPFSTSPELHSEESDLFSHHNYDWKPFRESCGNTTKVKGHQTKAANIHQTDNTFHGMTSTSPYASFSKCKSMVSPEHSSLPRATDNGSFALQDNFLSCDMTLRQDSEDVRNHDILGSRWGKESLEVDANLTEGSAGNQLTFGLVGYRNEAPFPSGCPKRLKKPFLRSCSLLGNVTPEKLLFANHQQFGVQIDEFRTKRKRFSPDDKINVVDADENDCSIDFFPNTSPEDTVLASSLSSNMLWECRKMMDIDVVSRNYVKPRLCDTVSFTEESDLLNDSLAQMGKRRSNHLSTNFESCSTPSFSVFGTTPTKVEHFTYEYATERNFRSCRSASFGNLINGEGEDEFMGYDTMQNGFINEDYPDSVCMDTEDDYEYFVAPKRNLSRTLSNGSQSNDVTFQKVSSSKRLADGTDWLCLHSSNMDNTNNCAGPTFHIPSPLHHNKDRYPRDELVSPNCSRNNISEGRSRRCRSAPPFYEGRHKFSTIYSCMTTTAGEINAEKFHSSPILPATSELKDSMQLFGGSRQYFESRLAEDSLFYSREHMENMPYSMQDAEVVQKSEGQKKSQLFQLYNTDPVEDFTSNEMGGSKFSGTKWRHGNPQTTFKNDRDKSHNLIEQNDVLDISSGLLHLAGGLVVPDSISKDCLDNAKVLLQLDKKFIPIVGGSVVAVIDQHAADERIRLEELRQKVLSGEGKTVAYLDSEQDLVLPEIGYQLLQNYAEQIQNWGWICNVDARGPGSFTKKLKILHRRPSAITLIAVPCILGVNLSDKDLLEFLEQLSETDGSSTMPPSVLRVLNFKSCRGAIMFGDALLPSECSLIVEELKQTSLCFQCAHGRPTTAPLVNLEALHKQIATLGLWNEDSDEVWHGLRRHRPSLERATQRLISARGQCG
ncbi:DNA mismatch repair protein [Macleaya cordata]|uniref:DNA mismatch repair protein n=1 Tax=Macleaya cordata TaxID=56857 RepID=A0A200PQY8_MACCD|nr:DNA mismatch repair protein [Macleaya cordata]